MMLRGLGDDTSAVNTTVLPGTTTTATNAPVPPATFTAGLSQWWPNPSAGINAVQTVISNASSAFSSDALPFTAGVLAVPAVLLLLLMGGKR